MKLDNLLSLVDQRWHEAFLRFVETGEAQKEFLSYLDKDARAQKAVDEAFTAQAAAFENLARELRTAEAEPQKAAAAANDLRARTVTASIVAALAETIELPPEDREDALHKAVVAIRAAVGPEKRHELTAVVAQLNRATAEKV